MVSPSCRCAVVLQVDTRKPVSELYVREPFARTMAVAASLHHPAALR